MSPNPWLVPVTALRRQPGARREERRAGRIGELSVAGSVVPAGAEAVAVAVLDSILGGIEVTADIQAPWEGECRRCLRPLHGELRCQVRELYRPRQEEGTGRRGGGSGQGGGAGRGSSQRVGHRSHDGAGWGGPDGDAGHSDDAGFAGGAGETGNGGHAGRAAHAGDGGRAGRAAHAGDGGHAGRAAHAGHVGHPQVDLDEDTYPLNGDQLDLRPLVRDALLLELPLAPLCRDDCRGLCAHCGADLNDGPCDCVPARDPRWSALDVLSAGEGEEGPTD